MILATNASTKITTLEPSAVEKNVVSGKAGGNGWGSAVKKPPRMGLQAMEERVELAESAFGGGIYAGNGSVSINSSDVLGNKVIAIAGGNGGNGGAATAPTANGGNGSTGQYRRCSVWWRHLCSQGNSNNR